MCSVWSCSHLWREQGANNKLASSGILLQMPVDLHGVGCEHKSHYRMLGPHATCFWQFAGGHFVELLQCSPGSSSHNGSDGTPAAGLMPFHSPVQLSLCSGWFSFSVFFYWQQIQWRDLNSQRIDKDSITCLLSDPWFTYVVCQVGMRCGNREMSG